MTIVVVTAVLVAPAAGASTYRTKGNGWHFSVSWTEFDPENLLGIPGNVHIGWLGAWSEPWGEYSFGHVSDFECPKGAHPYDWHHEEIVVKGEQVAQAAVEDAIAAIGDSGASKIESKVVVDTIQAAVFEEIPEEIIEEAPRCKWVQDRFLDGSEAMFTVDMTAKVATVKGNLIVHGGHGEHGETGPVLGRPAVDLRVEGGEWSTYEWSSKYQSATYRYSDWRLGTDYYGGVVTGAIGAMDFADDPDDESFGGFGSFKFRTVEKIRN